MKFIVHKPNNNEATTQFKCSPQAHHLLPIILRIHEVSYDYTLRDGQTSNAIHTPVRAQTQRHGETDNPAFT
jgi:hypothetical protein